MKIFMLVSLTVLLLLFSISCRQSSPDNPADPGPVSHSGRHSGNWEWQSPLPQGNHLNDVSFVDQSRGWAVGDYGTILHTTDGGNTWATQTSGTTETLTRVQFVDADRGWALVGANADPSAGTSSPARHAVLRSTDGGRHWDRTSLGGDNLYDMHFRDTGNGWITGAEGAVWHTADGGASWQQLYSLPDAHLAAVWFVSNSRGYAVGWDENGVDDSVPLSMTTADGGQTWTDSSYYYNMPVDISFCDDQRGWMCGHHGIWRTSDGGETWHEDYQSSSFNASRIVAIDDANAWTIGLYGTLQQSTDGGETWTVRAEDGVNGVCFADAYTGWYVGDYGTIARTGNGGWEWNPQSRRAFAQGMTDLYFTDPLHGWAVGPSGLMQRTTDGGDSWNPVFAASPTDHYFRITFLDSLHALAIGKTTSSLLILKSADGGASWAQNSIGIGLYGAAVDFCDRENGWVITNTGGILHTTDGGDMWEMQSGTPEDVWFQGVACIDPQTAWICSSGNGPWEARLLHTTDGGHTWVTRMMGGVSWLSDIVFADERNGWTVGMHGIILHTSDGGESWVVQPTGTSRSLNRIGFADRGTGIVVGDSGTVVVSVDGGESWQVEEGVTGNPLQAVFFTDPDHGWVGGSSGTIMRFRGTTAY